MSQTDFLIFTGIAGVALGYALLWVLTQFLKTDSEAAAMEKQMKQSIDAIERATGGAPQRTAPLDEVAVLSEAADLADEEAIAAEEASLARKLLGWGTAAWLAGMIGGGVAFGLVGALLGAVLASAVGAVAVVVAVVVTNRIAARREMEAEEATRLAEEEAAPSAPARGAQWV